MGNILSSQQEDLLYDRAFLDQLDHQCEDVYFLTHREISLIYSALRYADWESRWVDRDKDVELVEDLKAKLLSLCVADLVKSNLLLMGAITGRTIPLDDDEAVAALLSSPQDFSEDGLVPAIREISGASEDYSDELIEIATILGYVAV